MRIIIDTDGNSSNTKIEFNGIMQNKIQELHLSIVSGKRLKMQMIKDIEGKNQFLSYYGEDFKKFDDIKEN